MAFIWMTTVRLPDSVLRHLASVKTDSLCLFRLYRQQRAIFIIQVKIHKQYILTKNGAICG